MKARAKQRGVLDGVLAVRVGPCWGEMVGVLLLSSRGLSWNWELPVTSLPAPQSKFSPEGDPGIVCLYLPRSNSMSTHSTNILCEALF